MLWDLVFHDHRIWNSINDARGNLLEKFEVLGLVMAGVPTVVFATKVRVNALALPVTPTLIAPIKMRSPFN